MDELSAYIHLLRCPDCSKGQLIPVRESNFIKCVKCDAVFPVVKGRPILLKSDNSVFSAEDYIGGLDRPGRTITSRLKHWLPSLSLNLSSEKVFAELAERLSKRSKPTVVVVGCGEQKKWLNQRLGDCAELSVIYTDIDISADMDIVCDGHDLPFNDASVDAVITTAVLEHVLYPERVSAEIQRILKVGGYLYSELPFMQQVHEGAYDFTRYTLSGHRRLFNYIDEIDSGLVAGPGTALAWSIENFALAFANKSLIRKVIKGCVRVFFFWLKYFDYLLRNSPQAMDGACCTYLFGQRALVKIPDEQIIRNYVGSKNLSHT